MKAWRWITLVLAVAPVAFSIGDKERGNRLYRAGHYAEAAEAYAQALQAGDNSPELHYDYATALLRLGRYDEADRHFRAALRNTEPGLRERTLYNFGNRYLYAARALKAAGSAAGGGAVGSGQGAAPAQPGLGGPAGGQASAPDPGPLLDAAITAYEQALRIDSRDFDAKWNLELALEQKQQRHGGGGGQKKTSGGGGGAQKNPTPQGQGSENNQQQRNQMNQAQADRILSAAENDERQLYKDKVRKGNREVQVTRDW